MTSNSLTLLNAGLAPWAAGEVPSASVGMLFPSTHKNTTRHAGWDGVDAVD